MIIMQVLLIVVAAILFITLGFAAFKNTGNVDSMADMNGYLQALQKRMEQPGRMNPEAERVQMEILQNSLKAACGDEEISANEVLDQSFRQTTALMRSLTAVEDLENRASWIKLRQLTIDFENQYYRKFVYGDKLYAIKSEAGK